MPGDYSRFTYSALRDHIGVLMQQGRVMLDADFNEFIEIADRRFRSETIDIIGRCVVPRETPEGFAITLSGTGLRIGRGRAYVHGIQVENHGGDPQIFDDILAEQRGTAPVAYEQQPYLPNAATPFPAPAEGGPHLVYLDVWEREVTHVENPDLIEKAVGVDTASRLQAVWQVKVLPNIPAGSTCSSDIPAWTELTAPPAGRLTTAAVGVPVSTDPCIVNPAGGYRGTENRLYRVEVHAAGPLGTATFKWSRDNASVTTPVLAINAARDQLTVVRTGRDSVLRFSPADWIEITDDHHELAGLPGVLRKVQFVDDVTETITLASALPAGEFDGANPASRHTRIRRWDQRGDVLDAANNVVANVDASGGAIPIPASGNMVLEDGVQVEFSAAIAGGRFRTGDYWVCAARTVDASVEILAAAPPRGIHHHYCRLAIVTFPETVADCRTFWPPEFGGKDCECTACVSAESHNSGAFTIQMAVEKVRPTGGRICLGPGVFNLGATPVLLHGLQSVQLHGHGWRSTLFYRGNGAAISVRNSYGLDIDQLSVFAFGSETANAAVAIQNSALVGIEKCVLIQFGNQRNGPAIALGGIVVQTVIRDNILFGDAGVQSNALAVGRGQTNAVAAPRSYLLTLGLRITSNLIGGLRAGIGLDGFSLHGADTTIADNTIYGCRLASIFAIGHVLTSVLPASRLDITHNDIHTLGLGIVAGVDNLRITENDIGSQGRPRTDAAPVFHGILVSGAFVNNQVDRCQVIANRVIGLQGDGISVQGQVASLMIKQNILEALGGGGIVMADESRAGELSVENNQVLNVALLGTPPFVAGIRITRADRADISGNHVTGVAVRAAEIRIRSGIDLLGTRSAKVTGNEVSNVGPPGAFAGTAAGILVRGPFERLDVNDNYSRRALAVPAQIDNATWHALVIRQPSERQQPGTAVSADGRFNVGATLLFPVAIDTGALSDVLIGVNAAGLFVMPRGRELVAVRGNLLETYGAAQSVLVQAAGMCTFTENRCVVRPAPNTLPVIAEIGAAGAIASSNYLERSPRSDTDGLRFTLGAGPFTVVGNICSGRIAVNGSGLPAPWAPLNVFV